MSVNYNQTVLTQRLQVVANAIDAGPSNGFLRITDSGGTLLSSFQLARPCGTAAGAVLYFSSLSIIDPAAANTGTASAARLETSDGTVVASGLTVGTGATNDIVITPGALITAGQTVALTAATITGN